MVALWSPLSALAISSATLSLASALPTRPLADLFKRQSTSEIGSEGLYLTPTPVASEARLLTLTGASYPVAEWKASYPPAGSMPKPKQEWLDALAEVIKQGKIPNIPPAIINDGWCVTSLLEPLAAAKQHEGTGNVC